MISCEILTRKDQIASKIFDIIFKKNPRLKKIYTPYQKEKTREDIIYHLEYLAQAIDLGKTKVFEDYMIWVKIVLETRGLPKPVILFTLDCFIDAITDDFEGGERDVILDYLKAGKKALDVEINLDDEPFFQENPHKQIAKEYLDILLNGSRKQAIDFLLDLSNTTLGIKDLYLHVITPVQKQIGWLWQINKISVAKEHYCTAISQTVMSMLYPKIYNEKQKGKILVATAVGNELHEMGIRMVADFFEMDGWETYFLGANTPTDSVISLIKEKNADLLAISSILSKHLMYIEQLIAEVKKSEVGNIKIVVGGYPFNVIPGLWKDVGADGYAPDAEAAIQLGNELVQK